MRHPLIRPSNDEDKAALPWIDYSGLTAINTCPRWGLIHSVHGKRFTSSDRAMALEAGSAMHDVFSAVRMFELMDAFVTDKLVAVPDYVFNHGAKLYKSEQFPDRWNEAMQRFDERDDYQTRMMRFCLHILETSGFHDDPNDRRRTQTNLETAAINYIDRYPKQRFIPYTDAARAFVGVEIGFDIVLPTTPRIRFVGRTDGLCYDLLHSRDISKAALGVDENKTGARIDQHWANQFTVGHQPTGYLVALSAMLDRDITDGRAWGTQLPVPKASSFTDGQAREPFHRNARQMHEWLDWVQHTLTLAEPYMIWHDDSSDILGSVLEKHPTTAPMYTHSCNRYFRSCSLIPLCAEEPEERKRIFEQEMVQDRWNPLAEKEAE